MRLKALLIILMSCLITSCQSQNSSLHQVKMKKTTPYLHWKSMQRDGFVGEMQPNVADYIFRAENKQKMFQVGKILKRQAQDDFTGEREKLYIANLRKVVDIDPYFLGEYRNLLWSRQQKRGDVLYNIINFYAKYPEQNDKQILVRELKKLDIRQSQSQRLILWAMLKMPDLMMTNITYEKLDSICRDISVTTPAFGYVQPSNLQLCRRVQLQKIVQQGGNSEQESTILSEIRDDLEKQKLLAGDLLPLMDVLVSKTDDVSSNDLAIRLGLLGENADPRVELAVINLKLNKSTTDIESATIDKRLLKLWSQGEQQAAFLLGRLNIEVRSKVADPLAAEKYLIAVSESPDASYLLGKLYLSGMLEGTNKTQDGINLLVDSARKGMSKADIMLAEAFYNGVGFKSNKIYSWVFSSLALKQNPYNKKAQKLISLIKLNEAESSHASKLLEEELASRYSTYLNEE